MKASRKGRGLKSVTSECVTGSLDGMASEGQVTFQGRLREV